MRAVHSWLRELVPGLPDAHACADALTDAGLKVESVERLGFGVAVDADLDGGRDGVVVGEVVTIEELSEFKKPIRFVQVRVSEDGPLRGIVCGATNFAAGDRVPVALPGAVLPGGFAIGARETYGRVSDGMICSARELGLGDDHRGIMVLADDTPLGADVQALVGWPDAVLDIEVTTDRGYALTHRGIARELATAFGLEFHDPADVVLPPPVGSGGEVRIEDPVGCSHYVLRRMRAEALDTSATAGISSLADQARLMAAGMRPISRIVDVTNLVLLGIGQPLHAFDAAKLAGAVVIRRANPGERLETLDGVDRALTVEDLVIADDLGPVALAGVMGGARTEISETTTEVALESAHFDATLTARTSRRHGLASEASRRFERGVDPELARYGAELAAQLLLGDSAAESVHLTEVGTPLQLSAVTLPAGECERLGGRVYPVPTIKERLAQVGCSITGDDPLVVQPPSWRPDLTRAADLVEEVLRLEGYRTIPVTLPRAPAGRGLTAGQRARRRVTAAMSDAGFAEVLLLPFVAGDVAGRLGLDADDPRRAAVRVANPLADDEAFLRTALLPGLLAAAARNVSRGNPDVALFEAGTVFLSRGQQDPAPVPPVDRRPTAEELLALEATLPHQPTHIGAVLTGQRMSAGPLQPARAADWADAVFAAQTIALAAGATLQVAAGMLAPWHPGRCAELSVTTPDGPRVIGHAGELHPRVVADSELPARACALELDLGALMAAAEPPPVLPPLSPYPAADRDVALLVPAGVSASAVAGALRAGAGPDLEGLRLFDDFTTTEGQRSLAYRLRWRAGRTLTADEANALRDAAVAEAAARTGVRQRA
jgi:phenylalanyl-tRNA synthetase beta chain